MELSIFLARLFGVVYLAAGLGMLLNPDYYKRTIHDFIKGSSPLAVHIGAAMALVAGVSIVSFHNVWDGSWAVLVTILGWMAIVKGVMLFVFPEFMMNQTKSLFASRKSYTVEGVLVLILGLVLGYFGFVA